MKADGDRLERTQCAIMGNRITAYAAAVQTAIDSGQKVDGSGPIGDLVALEASLDVETFEVFAWKNAIALAQIDSVITLEEAITAQHALTASGNWRKGTSLALKVTITNLMGSLLARGLGADVR